MTLGRLAGGFPLVSSVRPPSDLKCSLSARPRPPPRPPAVPGARCPCCCLGFPGGGFRVIGAWKQEGVLNYQASKLSAWTARQRKSSLQSKAYG